MVKEKHYAQIPFIKKDSLYFIIWFPFALTNLNQDEENA